jgi:hypothetical protein
MYYTFMVWYLQTHTHLLCFTPELVPEASQILVAHIIMIIIFIHMKHGT